jgi:hypothetical protein
VSPVGAAEVDVDLAFNSAYVWRGLTMTDGEVMQPALTVSSGIGLSAGVWGNVDLVDDNDLAGEFQEVDLTIAWSLPLDSIVGVELGYIEYLFPNNVGPSTRELYLSTTLDLAVAPFAAVYYDFGEIADYYAQIGLSYGSELTPALSWEAAAWAGYAGAGFAELCHGKGSGPFDGNLSAAFSYRANDSLSLAGFVQYVDSLDSDILVEGNRPGACRKTDWLGGVSLTVSL